jgi:hypothetical protein
MGWRAYEHSDQLVKSFKEFAIAAKSSLIAIRDNREDVRSSTISMLIDQITERIKRHLDDLEKINLVNAALVGEVAAASPNSGERSRILRELKAITEWHLQRDRIEAADSIMASTLDALLDGSEKSYSVITFDDGSEDADLSALLRNMAVLDHDSPLAINALKRMSAGAERVAGNGRVLGQTVLWMKLKKDIGWLRHQSIIGTISLTELFGRLDAPDQRLLAVAAANTWLRLRLAWQVFEAGTANLGASTVFAFEQRNIGYHLIRDVLNIAWSSDWGNPEHQLPNGRNMVDDEHAKLRELFGYMFDCIDSVVQRLPFHVATELREPMRNRKRDKVDMSADDIIAGRRSELVLHVMRQQASLVTLKAYRVWLHAFIDVSPQFCGNRQLRKDRKIVFSKIFGELIAWGREVEACLASGDDRPREGRLGPAGRPASNQRQLSRKACTTKLVLVDIPFFGRGVVPDPEVLSEIISTCCHRERSALAAWERVQQVVPVGFLGQIPQLVV